MEDIFAPPGWTVAALAGTVFLATVVHELTKWLVAKLLAALRK